MHIYFALPALKPFRLDGMPHNSPLHVRCSQVVNMPMKPEPQINSELGHRSTHWTPRS